MTVSQLHYCYLSYTTIGYPTTPINTQDLDETTFYIDTESLTTGIAYSFQTTPVTKFSKQVIHKNHPRMS